MTVMKIMKRCQVKFHGSGSAPIIAHYKMTNNKQKTNCEIYKVWMTYIIPSQKSK